MTSLVTSSQVVFYLDRTEYNEDGSVKTNFYAKHHGNPNESVAIDAKTFEVMRTRFAYLEAHGTIEALVGSTHAIIQLNGQQGQARVEISGISMKVPTLNFLSYACVIL